MPESPRPRILIPAHNRRAFTLACLATLRSQGDLARCHVIVIDDGSTDGTPAAIHANFPEVSLLPGDGQLFWTGAIHLAMNRLADESPAAPIFWLNDDVRPQAGTLTLLTRWLEVNPNGIVGPRCIDAASGAVIPTGFVGRTPLSAGPGQAIAVQGLSGFCVGLGTAASQRLGPPDAYHFPHYGGDTAYTLRASHAGLPVCLLGDAVVELLHHTVPRLETSIRAQPTLAAAIQRIFFGRGSPFRIATLFALQRLKYGPFRGAALAAVRASSWFARATLARIRRS